MEKIINASKLHQFIDKQTHLSKGKILNFINTQSEDIVYCEDCANEICCGTKETFNICGVKNPFCCLGIKKHG